MVDKNELSRRLMATFLEELHDNIGVLNQNLLSLEKVPTSENRTQQINEIFRCAHTVKGAARAVNIELIEEACHRLEDILSEVRDGQRDQRWGSAGLPQRWHTRNSTRKRPLRLAVAARRAGIWRSTPFDRHGFQLPPGGQRHPNGSYQPGFRDRHPA